LIVLAVAYELVLAPATIDTASSPANCTKTLPKHKLRKTNAAFTRSRNNKITGT
jgi:hypothetical protein